MKLIDKRFWIFEGYTILYSILLMSLLCVVSGKPYMLDAQLLLTVICATSGLIAWLIANGKYWVVFGLIYEVVFITVISIFFWIYCCIISSVDEITLMMFFSFIPIIAIITVFPSVALSFFGYHIINKKGKDNRID